MKKLNLDEIKEMLGRIGPAIGESFDKVEDSWGEIKEAVTPDIENAKKEIKEHFQKSFLEFRKKINATSVDNVTMYEVETLTSTEMLKHAKAHIVKGANMVAAYKQEGLIKDKKVYLINFAYGKDRALLEDKDNHYVIIKANMLDNDVDNLFKESELVILK